MNKRRSAERTCNKKTKFGPTFYVFYTFNASVRSFVRPFVRPSVRPSVCLKPKFGQLFDLSCLNLRGSAERTCNKKTKFGPTFYVLYTFNASVRPSVRPSVCLSETKIWLTFRSVLLELKGVRGADVNKKTKFGPTFYVLYTFNASVRSSVFPSVRLSVRPSVCLKPKFGQLFDLSCLNLRGSAERTCNKKTKFGPTFYVL